MHHNHLNPAHGTARKNDNSWTRTENTIPVTKIISNPTYKIISIPERTEISSHNSNNIVIILYFCLLLYNSRYPAAKRFFSTRGTNNSLNNNAKTNYEIPYKNNFQVYNKTNLKCQCQCVSVSVKCQSLVCESNQQPIKIVCFNAEHSHCYNMIAQITSKNWKKATKSKFVCNSFKL